jgi:hypothetical protein
LYATRATLLSLTQAGKRVAGRRGMRSMPHACGKTTQKARAELPMGGRFFEVKYETLVGSPSTLQQIFAWLGIEEDLSACESAVRACDFDKLQRQSNKSDLPIPSERSPSGFFRKAQVGGWRKELRPGDLAIVEYICRDLMRTLQYTLATDGRRRPLRIDVHDALQRVRESIDWQLQRLLQAV